MKVQLLPQPPVGSSVTRQAKSYQMTGTGSAQAQEFDKQLREVAALYEKELHRSMVRALKQTVPESGLINKNQAERIFEEQLFDQYAEMMADQGSGALRQVIYDNLKMRYLNK